MTALQGIEIVVAHFRGLAFVVATATAIVCSVSTALAQTFEAFGPVLPMEYDRYGARHYHMYGWYGPYVPPMPSQQAPRPRQSEQNGFTTSAEGR